MSISVIVPSCGRPSLEYTVASVLQNLHPSEGDELIVVSPRKPEIIHPHFDVRDDFVWVQHDNGGHDPETLKSLNKESGYPSGGRERDLGRAVANGSHIAVIDDDDLYLPNSFELMRKVTTEEPTLPHIFRMMYGCHQQWMSPHAKDLIPLKQWRGFTEHLWVLWGEPIIELGNIGSAMYVLPNDASFRWDCSAPDGVKNVSEDFYVMYNYVQKNKIRPVFHKDIIGIIRPTPEQVATALGITKPEGLRYAPQTVVSWDGRP